MLHSKKGLSPLIGAIILIVIVVGIGAIVTGMVRNLITENKQTISSKSGEMECSRDVMVDMIKFDDEYRICKGSDYVDVVIENKGAAEVDDFQVVIMAVSGFFSNDSVSSGAVLAPGQATELNVSFSGFPSDDILQVKVVPKLKKSGSAEYHFCSDAAVKSEIIPEC